VKKQDDTQAENESDSLPFLPLGWKHSCSTEDVENAI